MCIMGASSFGSKLRLHLMSVALGSCLKVFLPHLHMFLPQATLFLCRDATAWPGLAKPNIPHSMLWQKRGRSTPLSAFVRAATPPRLRTSVSPASFLPHPGPFFVSAPPHGDGGSSGVGSILSCLAAASIGSAASVALSSSAAFIALPCSSLTSGVSRVGPLALLARLNFLRAPARAWRGWRAQDMLASCVCT